MGSESGNEDDDIDDDDDDLSDGSEAGGFIDDEAEESDDGESGFSDEEEDLWDDDSDEEEDEEDEEDEERTSSSRKSKLPNDSGIAASVKQMMGEQSVVKSLLKTVDADVQKGKAVQRQRKGFDALLNLRIRLQKAASQTCWFMIASSER